MPISIPSGAIKSIIFPEYDLTRNVFQFLLVRLRVSMDLRISSSFYYISIPSGAIKSINGNQIAPKVN